MGRPADYCRILALALPFEAGVAIAIAVAILVIIAGVVHLAGTFAARTTGGFFWRLLVGCAYLIAGVYLLMHPKLSLVSLTLALAVLFFVEAIFHIAFSTAQCPWFRLAFI